MKLYFFLKYRIKVAAVFVIVQTAGRNIVGEGGEGKTSLSGKVYVEK